MWFQVDGWYWREPRAAIVARMKRILHDGGVTLDEQLERQVSVQAIVDGVEVAVEVAGYTEEHMLVRLTSARVTQGVLELFEHCAKEMVMGQNPSLGELIWGWNADELAPVLMHSHWRGEYPSPLSILDPELLTSRTLQPQDDAYWLEVGPRLHFVHHKTFGRFNDFASSAASLEQLFGRQALPSQHGVIFDCGWSLRWPKGIPETLLTRLN